MLKAELEKRFTYHAPPNDEVVRLYGEIRAEALLLADRIDESQPDSREKSLAITALEEAVMWANAGIARNGASFSA